MKTNGALRLWEDLSSDEQLHLREEYGHYLEQLPPTCSMEIKEVRFAAWLAQRGVTFRKRLEK